MFKGSEEHFIGKVAQKALIEKAGEILITKDFRNSAVWEIPGGRLNAGERPIDSLKRELQEELGVDVDIHNVVYVGQFNHQSSGATAPVLVYFASLIGEKTELNVDEIELAELAWVNSSNWQEYKYFPVYEAAPRQFFQS